MLIFENLCDYGHNLGVDFTESLLRVAAEVNAHEALKGWYTRIESSSSETIYFNANDKCIGKVYEKK